ncbi:YolD-like family protein [Bacillus subtilis]|uniref:YolD-like family protein n=1 Tax=Bacillus subtilis TaxID=1423 RepID=UPI00203E34FE|nr:YolD-like family protein [Bacillus subtilis]MCM3191264.1 YolD-like family protein [Bacillus subtilis]
MDLEDKRWSSRIILPEHRAGLTRLAAEKQKVVKPQLDAQQIEEMEITVAESMEFGSSLTFDIYDNGYIREVTGSVHYVDHIRKEFRIKDTKGDTNFVRFINIVNVKKAPSD